MTVHEPTTTDRPRAAHRTLDFHPGMGMRWEITHSTDDTSGQLLQSTNWVDRRMPGPPVHVHPSSEESFEVIEGTLDVFVDGQFSQVGAGERTTMPGVPHTLGNASDAPVKMRTIVEPAGRAEAFFRDMHRLIRKAGSSSFRRRSRARRTTLAMLFCAYPDVIRSIKRPHWLIKALAGLGRALRFRLEP